MRDGMTAGWLSWDPDLPAGEGPRLPSEDVRAKVACSPGVLAAGVRPEVGRSEVVNGDGALAGNGWATAITAAVVAAVTNVAETFGTTGTAATAATTVMNSGLDDQTFEELVQAHYEALYRFAYSLAQSESDARDLVQETYAQLARKGSQIKSVAKAKSWLFTTLYRSFVDGRRREVRHPKVEIESAELELPVTEPEVEVRIDAATVQAALLRIDEVFRAPLVLFYLEDHSYTEIADILNIPAGTVMSRISRGRAMLRRQFAEPNESPAAAGAPGASTGSRGEGPPAREAVPAGSHLGGDVS